MRSPRQATPSSAAPLGATRTGFSGTSSTRTVVPALRRASTDPTSKRYVVVVRGCTVLLPLAGTSPSSAAAGSALSSPEELPSQLSRTARPAQTTGGFALSLAVGAQPNVAPRNV